jgi:RNA polymerase sigma factor (TIGR02999 family)
MANVTQLLSMIETGDPKAGAELLPVVYVELRHLAAQRMSHESPGQTLDATGLVHEAYLRLVNDEQARGWQSRGHFFAAAAEAMRRILVDRARRKKRIRHGGQRQRVELQDIHLVYDLPSDDLMALDEALQRLEAEDRTKAELVKLRFFTGLTSAQAAQVLGISKATADRYWTYTRAWLYHEITKDERKD